MRLWVVAALVATLVGCAAPPTGSQSVYDDGLAAVIGDADTETGAPVAAPGASAFVRVPRPAAPAGPRRIGLQAGHWRTAEVPAELKRLETLTGTSGGGVSEWELNLDIANRVAAVLRE